MKTLFIAPQVPWPLDVGSKIRAFHLLKSYASLGRVTAVCSAANADELAAATELERHLPQLRCIAVPTPERGAPLRGGKISALEQAIQPRPKLVLNATSPALVDAMAAQFAAGSFDILHVERLAMTENVLRALPQGAGMGPVLRVLDVDDVESVKAWRSAANEPWTAPRRYLQIWESLKLRVYERRVSSAFNWLLVCSRKDQAALQLRFPGADVRVYGNGADLDELSGVDPDQDDGRTLVCFGAMNYPPNNDAALYFADRILPLVRRRIPQVRLVIAGKSPSREVLALDNGEAIRVTGYVDNKPGLFSSSTVFVVPIRAGGGTRIKILEAMAAGKPVVSTSVGCEGIDAVPGREIVVADDPNSFADACSALLTDAPRRRALGQAGRALIAKKYRWADIRGEYARALQAVLSP